MSTLKPALWRKVSVFIILAQIFLLPRSLSALSSDLTELSIEELANIEVISVSRKPQKQSQSAAAIFVITAEDIRRSGVTSIPEALRMVPGLDVARLSSSKWAVSSRGFNSRYSNKLLVLLDGRSLYLPLFSGVFWENQDLFMEDIERIEVVRGPGASLWGSNAVNGVINIITKHSKDTQGTEAIAGGGDYERGFSRARYGGKLSDKSFVRAYASYFNRDEMVDENQDGLGDPWKKFQTGFRSDSELGDSCNLTVQGDVYKGFINEKSTVITLSPPLYSETLELDNETTGYNLLSRYTHRFSGGSETSFQAYYDTMDKEEGTVKLEDSVLDFDWQYRLSPVGINEFTFGLGYRLYKDEVQSPVVGIGFATPSRENSLYSSFIQDTVMFNDAFQMVIGSRFEHNEFTGFEIQPNIRFMIEPNENNLFWTAVSRAVRTPSRGDNDIRFTTTIIPPEYTPDPTDTVPTAVTIWGLSNYKAENLMAYEVGHRLKSLGTFSLDTTAFYYHYDNLATAQITSELIPVTVNGANYNVNPLNVGNGMEAQTWGAELSANWQAASFMRFMASYTFFKADLDLDNVPGIQSMFSDNDAPKNQASLRTFIEMPHNTECDVWVRYIDDVLEGAVGSYTEMDVRLGWKPSKHIELSLCGQNLLHKSHAEYMENYVLNASTEVPRSVYGKVTMKF